MILEKMFYSLQKKKYLSSAGPVGFIFIAWVLKGTNINLLFINAQIRKFDCQSQAVLFPEIIKDWA